MSHVFAVDTTIGRPPAEVWATLTDWEQAPRWMTGIDSMVVDEGLTDPLAPGTTLTFRARGKDRPAEVAAVDQDGERRRVVLRSTQGGVVADYTYTVSPDPADAARSQVSLVADCTTSGIWSALAPVIKVAMRRTDRGQLDALKAHIEHVGPGRGPVS